MSTPESKKMTARVEVAPAEKEKGVETFSAPDKLEIAIRRNIANKQNTLMAVRTEKGLKWFDPMTGRSERIETAVQAALEEASYGDRKVYVPSERPFELEAFDTQSNYHFEVPAHNSHTLDTSLTTATKMRDAFTALETLFPKQTLQESHESSSDAEKHLRTLWDALSNPFLRKSPDAALQLKLVTAIYRAGFAADPDLHREYFSGMSSEKIFALSLRLPPCLRAMRVASDRLIKHIEAVKSSRDIAGYGSPLTLEGLSQITFKPTHKL